MPRYASTYPFHELEAADYEGCAIPVRTADQAARQYAADTIRLADQPRSTGRREPRATVRDLSPDEHAAEARRLDVRAEECRANASRQRAIANPVGVQSWEAQATHFQGLADWHDTQSRREPNQVAS